MRQIVVGFAGLLLAAGCSSIFGLDQRSIILPISQVDAPSTVAPGASFNVTFTVASGGFTDPFFIVGKQPDAAEMTVQVRVQ